MSEYKSENVEWNFYFQLLFVFSAEALKEMDKSSEKRGKNEKRINYRLGTHKLKRPVDLHL